MEEKTDEVYPGSRHAITAQRAFRRFPTPEISIATDITYASYLGSYDLDTASVTARGMKWWLAAISKMQRAISKLVSTNRSDCRISSSSSDATTTSAGAAWASTASWVGRRCTTSAKTHEGRTKSTAMAQRVRVITIETGHHSKVLCRHNKRWICFGRAGSAQMGCG
ncbi:unnamed protein product [Phytophthora lilii]|uniref:Unnamed protein product n=1 Tax=Phytophthora lilii TaxID=2077276 RepID=A0A9W6X775_9STRA|nr:unnamed protein product [Phytophthora lilii]